MLLEYNAGIMQERMCTAEEMSTKNWHDHVGCRTVQQWTGRWVGRCTTYFPPGRTTRQGNQNLGLTGQTAKAADNANTMQEQMCWDAAAGNHNALQMKGAEKTGVITLAVKHCSNARVGGWHDALQIICKKPQASAPLSDSNNPDSGLAFVTSVDLETPSGAGHGR